MAISSYLRDLRAIVGHRLLLTPAAVALVFDAEARLLMVRLGGHAEERYGLPGGGVDPGESPQEAVVRETREETGLEVAVDGVHAVYGGPGMHVTWPGGDEGAYVMTAFLCRVVGGTPHVDGDEVTALRWVARDEVEALPLPEWARIVVPDAFGAVKDRVAPPQRIETERLTIRTVQPADAPAQWASVDSSRAHLQPWMPWVDATTSEADTREVIARFGARWARREDFPLGIFEREGGAHVGGTGFHLRSGDPGTVELGYWIRADREGRGYVTEAVAALVHAAFEDPAVHRVEVRMDPRNARSSAVPRRLGFVEEGTLRSSLADPDGQRRDTLVYALVRGDELPLDPRLLA